MSRNIGLDVQAPRTTCTDVNCPFHGALSVRGKTLDGIVTRDSMDRTVIVRRNYSVYMPKFKRYERRHSHIAVHNPSCVGASVGDKVRIVECRPLSKSVSFVVVRKDAGSTGI